MKKILFICTGNTCRSPMAEVLFRKLGGEQKTGLQAESAGLYTQDGLPASENAAAVMREYGADLSAHRAQMLTKALAGEADYLVCMTAAQCDRVIELAPESADKLFTLLPTDVDDPFGGGMDIYRRAAGQIEQGVKSIIERLSRPL